MLLKPHLRQCHPMNRKLPIEQELYKLHGISACELGAYDRCKLIRYVGEESFATWTKLENQGCHSIYDFTRHFNLSADELAELIITNELDEIYDVEILKERYSQGA